MLDLYESLAVEMKCPPDLQPMLESIIPPERVPLLLSFADWLEPAEAAAKLDISVEEVKKATFELYRDGFVIRKKSAIKTRSFYGIVNTLLGEGRLGHLSEEQRSQLKEFYMLARLQIYDRYLAEGRLATSSRVLAIYEEHHRRLHADNSSVVVASDEAFAILNRARSLALVPCSCRLTFKNCLKPVNTCINLDASAEELLERGVGQQISVEEGYEILAIANREGLVHLAISSPEQADYALCSCCSCCCHDLQALLRYGRLNWIHKAGVIAQDNPLKCEQCFICADRCIFGARRVVNGEWSYDPQKCYGCGLCASSCPAGAITLLAR